MTGKLSGHPALALIGGLMAIAVAACLNALLYPCFLPAQPPEGGTRVVAVVVRYAGPPAVAAEPHGVVPRVIASSVRSRFPAP